MLLGFVLTLLAGLSTVVGGFIGIHSSLLKNRSLAMALGFSAGVMVYISFMELLPQAKESLTVLFGHGVSMWVVSGSFILGMLAVGIFDRFAPQSGAYETDAMLTEAECADRKNAKCLLRSGLFVAAVLTLHNLPEGMATLIGTLHDPALGISLAVAIAIHNIPEGIAVAAPIYAATKSRTKALLYTAVSGLAEPVGALIGYFLIIRFLPEGVMGIIFSCIAGMMIYISVSELLPAAKNYESHRQQTIVGFIGGIIVVTIGLNLLAM